MHISKLLANRGKTRTKWEKDDTGKAINPTLSSTGAWVRFLHSALGNSPRAVPAEGHTATIHAASLARRIGEVSGHVTLQKQPELEGSR